MGFWILEVICSLFNCVSPTRLPSSLKIYKFWVGSKINEFSYLYRLSNNLVVFLSIWFLGIIRLTSQHHGLALVNLFWLLLPYFCCLLQKPHPLCLSQPKTAPYPFPTWDPIINIRSFHHYSDWRCPRENWLEDSSELRLSSHIYYSQY